MAKQKKGFAAMDPEKQKQIASKGGKSLSLEVRREIGRKGGLARAEKLRKSSAAILLEPKTQQPDELVMVNQSAEPIPVFVQKEKSGIESLRVEESSTVVA